MLLPALCPFTANGKLIEIKPNECVVLAQQDPLNKAWGEGISFNESIALTLAKDAAYKLMAHNIMNLTYVTKGDVSEVYCIMDNKLVYHRLSKNNEFWEPYYSPKLIEWLERNTVVIQKCIQNMPGDPDGANHVYVCIEFTGTEGLDKIFPAN